MVDPMYTALVSTCTLAYPLSDKMNCKRGTTPASRWLVFLWGAGAVRAISLSYRSPESYMSSACNSALSLRMVRRKACAS